MKSHELIRSCFEQIPPKKLAGEIGVSQSLLYKWSEPTGELQSGTRNPLDRVLHLNRSCPGNRIIKWLCAKSGGFFIDNPNADESQDYEVVPATNEIVQQFASLLSEIAQAAIDQRITEAEAEDIRERWDDLKCYCEGFVNACERGDFDELRQRAQIAAS